MATFDANFRGDVKGPTVAIWLVALTVALVLIWAKFAVLDEVARVNTQTAAVPQDQSLAGGQVGEADGVAISETRADLEGQVLAAEVRRLRLEAEMNGASTFHVPGDIATQSPSIVAFERALFAGRQNDYLAKVAGAERMQAETARELAMMEDMYARDIVSLVEVIKARNADTDANIRLSQIKTRADLNLALAHADMLNHMAELRQRLGQSTGQ